MYGRKPGGQQRMLAQLLAGQGGNPVAQGMNGMASTMWGMAADNAAQPPAAPAMPMPTQGPPTAGPWDQSRMIPGMAAPPWAQGLMGGFKMFGR